MCGIFFVINPKLLSTSSSEVYRSFKKGSSRGPDNSQFIEYEPYNNQPFYIGFNRLSINGLNNESNQPIHKNNITLICNGEIYNYKSIIHHMNIKQRGQSDCEVIIDLYIAYGIEYTVQTLDGVFAFVLIDNRSDDVKCFIARDPYGVRPMYKLSTSYGILIGVSSDMKSLIHLKTSNMNIEHVAPNTCSEYETSNMDETNIYRQKRTYPIIQYKMLTFTYNASFSLNEYISNLKHMFIHSVQKRVENTDRKVACLLSGGLDSSLVTSISNLFVESLETFSIGLHGGEDLKYAKQVASFLNTKHTEVIVEEDDFFDAIEEVIYTIESYDTTTIRASVGNYLVSKHISEHSNAKVILNGDGSDELMGGYLYMHQCKNNIEFDIESKRLLQRIHKYDCLRSDKSISSNGLEPRTPFLDKSFVDYYLSIPIEYRNHNNFNEMEKYLIRKAFDDGSFLPKDVLWRRKEAFSDGVSHQNKSWYEIIQEKVQKYYKENKIDTSKLFQKYKSYKNPPTTLEQLYYRDIFEKHYPYCKDVIDDFWMPKYVDSNDSSARTLPLYNKLQQK